MSLMHQQSQDDLQGYMMKQGGRIKTWKRRFFVVRDQRLMYFDHIGEDMSKPKGSISLTRSIVNVSNVRPLCFTVKPAGNARTYVIQASTDELRWEWIVYLCSVGGQPHEDIANRVSAEEQKKLQAMAPTPQLDAFGMGLDSISGQAPPAQRKMSISASASVSSVSAVSSSSSVAGLAGLAATPLSPPPPYNVDDFKQQHQAFDEKEPNPGPLSTSSLPPDYHHHQQPHPQQQQQQHFASQKQQQKFPSQLHSELAAASPAGFAAASAQPGGFHIRAVSVPVQNPPQHVPPARPPTQSVSLHASNPMAAAMASLGAQVAHRRLGSQGST